ncbi:hypothetical protein D3C80_1755330 [compost metagenome]
MAAAARAAYCWPWKRLASFSVSSRAAAGCIWAMMAARVRGRMAEATGRRTLSSKVAKTAAASLGRMAE